MFCSRCGNEMPDTIKVCPSCSQINNNADVPTTGMKIVSVLFPIVGLIYYLVNITKSPIKSKEYGRYAIIGILVFWVFYSFF